MYDDSWLEVFQFDLELLHIPLRVYDFSCILHFHITLLTQIIFFTHHTTQNVGGPSSSFGIWHEQKDQVKAMCAKYGLKVIRIHTHIGSGSDPVVWQSVTGLSLGLVEEFPEAVALNLGGGYKVGRMSYEASTDLLKVGAPVKKEFEDFAARTGRKLKLEIEPGTFLVANAGTLLCSVQVTSAEVLNLLLLLYSPEDCLKVPQCS